MALENTASIDPCFVLTKSQRDKVRARSLRTSLTYFENRSMSAECLFTRRRNLAAHLGVDETVSKKELNMINVYALPLPSSKKGLVDISAGYYFVFTHSY